MALSFTNSIQDLTYRKVSDYLSSSNLFKNSVHTAPDRPRFDVRYGSTVVIVDVLPWEVHPWETSELAIVKASSCVTEGSNVDNQLMQYLLCENQRMLFGAFHLDAEQRVWFSESVLGGESMEIRELQTCILSVATIADNYDDILCQRFGGQGASQLLSTNF
jgi:hypothetical protein